MNWEDGIRFCLNKRRYFTLEFYIWIYILQVRSRTIPYFNVVRKKWRRKNFGPADWFFKVFLSGWSSVAAPLTGKIYSGCQVGWRKAVYYFLKKKFRYHLLAYHLLSFCPHSFNIVLQSYLWFFLSLVFHCFSSIIFIILDTKHDHLIAFFRYIVIT